MTLTSTYLVSVLLAAIFAGSLGAKATDGVETCSAEEYASGTCRSSPAAGAGGCIDQNESCPKWAKGGGCESSENYMKYHCTKSCDTCRSVSEEKRTAKLAAKDGGSNAAPCRDTHYQCVEWAGMGECDDNPNYMLKGCKRACLVCFDGTEQFGIEQRVPNVGETTEVDRQKTRDSIQQSMKYMQRVWRDAEFKDVRHKCKNQHSDCTWWSAIGECDANPTYMRTNCAPSCATCDLLDISHRCPIEPGNEPIWQPGDLNKLMENIVDDADGSGEWKRYNAKAMSRPKNKRDGTLVEGVERDGPWIVILDNFVSTDEADRLVELGVKQGYERSADVGKEKPDGSHDSQVSDARTSHNTWCQEKSCSEDELVVPVVERIGNVTRTGYNNSEYLQLLQYEPGQYYKQHHDYIGHHQRMPCGVRILTLFIYLNDVEEGGGTHFPLLDITVWPKKGSALLWPSVRDDTPEKKDGRTDHEALPVISGLKYGANAWIHSRNFKAAYAKNCH